MSTLTTQNLIDFFHAQTQSADLWIREWNKWKDISAMRNAALAIGRVQGIYSALIASTRGNKEKLPKDVIEKMKSYSEVFDNLNIPERT